LRSRGGFFTVVVIFFGLGLTVWWMYSAEETVSTPRKVVFESPPQQVQVKSEVAIQKNNIERAPASSITQARKLAVLQEILDSKNDNDPRLDTDFKTLNESEKIALQEKYLSYTPEKLNERGTLIYLLGRNIENKKDLKFMEYVLNEKPCLSMSNCSIEAPAPTGEAAHLASIDKITLSYPQIVAIKSIEPLLSSDRGNDTLKTLARKNLESATHSKSSVVAHMAALTLKKIAP
jgi:hypothetical protein